MGVARLDVMVADEPQDVGLPALFVQGVAHRLAVEGENFVGIGTEGVPPLQSAVQQFWVDAGPHFADDDATGDLVALVAPR